MPRPRHPRAETREQWLERTESARRAARFKFALERIDKIAAGDPPLTPIFTQRIDNPSSGELEAQLAAAPPGNGHHLRDVSLAKHR
jgi:hypothetical protein